MLGLTHIDWTVIVGYLLVITLIGTWAMRRVTSTASLFISDRKFGKLMMMFFTFGTGTHSDQAVSVAAKTYHAGASGIWYQWLWLPVTPFFWLLAPLSRRMRAVTIGDYFHARYDRGVASLYAVVGILQLMVNIGVMLKGSSAMITAVSGGAIDPNLAIIAMTVIFWKVAAMMAIAFWAGLIWRRASAADAWASTLVSFAVLLATSTLRIGDTVLWDFNQTCAPYLPDFMLFDGKLFLPWQMILYLSVGFVTVIVVSLFTRPVDAAQLDRFYQTIRTPIQPGEPETEPFTLPSGVEPAPRNVWIDHPTLEIPRPSLVSVIGFLAGWAAVGLLIGGFYWILAS